MVDFALASFLICERATNSIAHLTPPGRSGNIAKFSEITVLNHEGADGLRRLVSSVYRVWTGVLFSVRIFISIG